MPTVDVIIPARQAAQVLEGCLASIEAQSLAPDRVLVAIGPSTDETEAVATMAAARNSTIRIVPNPQGDRASAINAALRHAGADWVAMIDAQSRLAADYLATAVAVGEAVGAAVVGGPMRPSAPGVIGGAIAAALRSRFGVGDSRFHRTDVRGPVDSVYLGVYRRTVFETLGAYDETKLRTEDDDMNARIRAAGERLWLDPSIHSTYLCRRDLPSLARQYHGYGFWKARFVRERPSEARARHLVPAAFVIGLAAAGLTSVVVWRPALPLVIGTYAAAAYVAAAGVSGVAAPSRLAFPLATATMHAAYGVGFLRGVFSR